MNGTLCPVAHIDVVIFNAVVRFEGDARTIGFSQAAAVGHHSIEGVAITIDVFYAGGHCACTTFSQKLKLAAAGTIAVPEVRLCADGQVLIDFEFGFACEQIVAKWVDVEFVEAVSG